MEIIIAVAIIIIVLVIGFVVLDRRLRTLAEPKNDTSFLLLNQNIQGMQQTFNERLDGAAKAFAGLNKELGTIQEMNRSMKDLQDFLKSPKLRGNIGEQVMKDLLEQYFPRGNFDLQYQFNSGEKVDAIIKTDKGLIPIDAKFPLENFQRLAKAETEELRVSTLRDFVKDVKKHITDISKKYILPAENTVDFAIMYIPSESVYYEIIQNDAELNQFAHEKRVFPVSPNSFFYFMKVIMIGMEGKRIEEASQKILMTLKAIQQDASRFGGELDKLTTHVTNAKNTADRVNNEYAKLSGRIDDVRLLK